MMNQRIVAGALAVSGVIFAIFAWMIPIFWPGYVIWVGWICVAVGSKNWAGRWFWIISAVWNGALLALFFAKAGGKSFIYEYARLHLIAAIGASIFLFVFQPRLKAKSRE